MVKVISILALTAAAIAVRRFLQANQDTQPVTPAPVA
jgi:hypothetical protein